MSDLELYIPQNRDRLSYESAWELQKKLNQTGKKGWLVFTPPPVITLGKRIHGNFAEHLKQTPEQIKKKGVSLLAVSRGGLATFHGPGQLVLFPYGSLRDHTGNPRGVKTFIEKTILNLMKFIADERGHTCLLDHSVQGKLSGIWIKKTPDQDFQKILSVGIAVAKTGLEHGFALNLFSSQKGTAWGFDQIHPCGERSTNLGFLYENCDQEMPSLDIRRRIHTLFRYLQ